MRSSIYSIISQETARGSERPLSPILKVGMVHLGADTLLHLLRLEVGTVMVRLSFWRRLHTDISAGLCTSTREILG